MCHFSPPKNFRQSALSADMVVFQGHLVLQPLWREATQCEQGDKCLAKIQCTLDQTTTPQIENLG